MQDARTTVLITGFGPFPGVPVNATMQLVPELAQAAARQFAGVRIATEVLATEWTSAPRRLDGLLAEIEPDLVLHFGVSPRARGFEIEARARNVCTQAPDAAGALPVGTAIRDGGAEFMAASLPAQHIVARLRRRGIPAFVSRDAGGYLCNATLYHSLGARATHRPPRRVHPHPATLGRPAGRTAGASVAARSPGSRRTPAGWRSWPRASRAEACSSPDADRQTRMETGAERLRGAALVCAAAVCWSLGGLFVRLIGDDLDGWTIAFWRSAFMVLSGRRLAVGRERAQGIRRLSRHGLGGRAVGPAARGILRHVHTGDHAHQRRQCRRPAERGAARLGRPRPHFLA
jgi:pyroglutamyl-peptidase